MSSLFTLLSGPLQTVWSALRKAGAEHGVLPLVRPVAPYDGSPLLAPLATLGIVLALVATSGIALAALGVLVLALLALWLLLTEVLGISIEVRPFPV